MTPRSDAHQIIANNSDLAAPLIRILVWASLPGTSDSAEFDDVLDDLLVKLPEFRKWRDTQVEALTAVAAA